MTLRSLLLVVLITSGGCARQHYFQPDARLPGAAGQAGPDSARITAGRHYRHGGLYSALMGRHYRTTWATPVTVPVLDLRRSVPGGLLPGKLGGGFQSTSMTLLGADGRAYALRSLDKDPYKTLPKPVRNTFLLNMVRDATSAANPYGALVVPPLAEAAGVLHTNPRPFYISSTETGLGPASARFQGKLVILEEKYEGKKNITPAMGSATNLVDSEDMLRQRYEHPEHQVDQLAFARARLLDIWLGDWDRHEGQWQWAEYEDAPNRIRYRPIPKDRDQVFYRFDDGLVPWLASRRWAAKKFRTFKPDYELLPGLVSQARFLDKRFLTEVTEAQFQTLARDLQRRLTDAVIEKAAHRLPPAVFALEGPRLIKALQARRAALPEVAAAYYRLLARRVELPGTDEDERFVVRRLTDTTTAVTIYHLFDKDGDKFPLADSVLYRRVFHHRDTEQLTLYGLDGSDEFVISGNVGQGLRIDVYGGPGADLLQDVSRVRRGRKRVFFRDTNRGNVLEPGPNTSDKTHHGVDMHAYDREGY